MAQPKTCIRYQEDELNAGAGAGLCFCPDNGFNKEVPKCADKIRAGTCTEHHKTPYLKGGKA